MTEASAPLPCPFCGAADIEKTDNGHAEWLRCLTCGATGPWREPPEDHCFTGTELVDQWNARPSDDMTALLSRVLACRMEAGEGRFVNLAKLRAVMPDIEAALSKETALTMQPERADMRHEHTTKLLSHIKTLRLWATGGRCGTYPDNGKLCAIIADALSAIDDELAAIDAACRDIAQGPSQ